MIKRVKRLIIRCFIAIEIAIFAWIYCFGARGLHVVLHLRQQNKAIEALCNEHVTKINKLEQELADWRAHKDFYYEKYAREQLHMAHDQDQVIFINN